MIRLRFSLFLLLISAFAFGKANNNCGCEQPASFEQAYKKANIVFLGSCIDISPNAIKGGLNIVFQVDSSWKRGVEQITTVHTNSTNQCGYEFKQGSKYIVFGNKKHQTISSTSCEPNQLFSEGGAETLEKLGRGILPGRPELAWNLTLLLTGMGIAGLLFLAFVIFRKKFKR